MIFICTHCCCELIGQWGCHGSWSLCYMFAVEGLQAYV
jgi:hypothetical protein